MTKIEMEFFDEYKAVDNICRDMFQTQQGVTEYINQMEANDLQGSRRVVNWNEKYKMLKHLRWLRNQIAHDNSAPELEENDLIELQHFHTQLLNQKDPLAVLFKVKRETTNNSAKKRVDYSSFEAERKEEHSVSPFVVALVIGVATIMCIVLFSMIL